jgi:hypothetical protein
MSQLIIYGVVYDEPPFWVYPRPYQIWKWKRKIQPKRYIKETVVLKGTTAVQTTQRYDELYLVVREPLASLYEGSEE